MNRQDCPRSFALNSGDWQVPMGIEPYGRWAERAGERPHSTLLKPKFFVGNRRMDFSVDGRAKGSATQTTGISLDEVGLDLEVGFEQEHRLYSVQHASGLTIGFTNLAEHILSTPPENFFLDTTARNGQQGFYRIRVE